MTRFSFEVPIAHLDDFEDLQDFIFSLSYLYADPYYRSWMARQRDKGERTIWLDNSYNELLKAQDMETLRDIIEWLNPRKVISPAAPDWSVERLGGEFVRAKHYVGSTELIAVVNSREMHQHLVNLGATHFAISYWNRPSMGHEMVRDLQPAHFLGLLSPNEIIALRPPTCDTSMPIKLAIQNQTIEQWVQEGCPHIYTHKMGTAGEDFFHLRMSDQMVELARKNIIHLKEMCNAKR
jgi:hypothetical protein